jgi:hypothetical protein
MQKLEAQLDDLFVKKAPFQLPEGGRRGLVSALPWLTLVGGILMLMAAWGLWQLVTWADRWAGFANSLSASYGGAVSGVSPLIWLSLAILAVEAIMFFVAFPALRDHKKKGWDILFWISIINVVEALLQAIAYSNFGSLIMSLVGSVMGLYLLFQVRAYYTGEKKMPVAATTPGATAPTTNAAPTTPAAKPASTTPPEKKV